MGAKLNPTAVFIKNDSDICEWYYKPNGFTFPARDGERFHGRTKIFPIKPISAKNWDLAVAERGDSAAEDSLQATRGIPMNHVRLGCLVGSGDKIAVSRGNSLRIPGFQGLEESLT
jgi:hypothetical protein